MGFIEDLEQSIDIVELIGRYAKLKKAGVNYKALCPFPGHSEKTASFVVSPAKQIGYCFWCHKGGWPIKFITDMENCEFREAVQILWNITGREIKWFTENKEKIEIKKNLYSLYRDATSYYKSALEKHPEVKKYLIDRWLSPEDITKFHFWYADSGQALYSYLKEKWYEDELITTSGIFMDVTRRKDKFIGRVIFPIQNLRGDFVAFAGRILWKWEPKYLNSPASDIYDKSSILYWLFDARNTITKVDHIIITEWYMDTIALHRAWFFQSVAVSWTALTEKHITIIKRLTHKIYLCFDNDKAWEQATRSSLEILKNMGLEVKIISIKSAKDPDEYIENWWDFQGLIDTALSPIAYLINKNKYDLTSIDEKKKFIGEILDIIRNYSDSIEQDMYLKELSSMSSTPVWVIYEMFKNTKAQKKEAISTPEKHTISPEDTLIALIYNSPEIVKSLDKDIIFPEAASTTLKKAIDNIESFIRELSLSEREKYKALAMKYSSENEDSEAGVSQKQSALLGLNKWHYKNLSANIKEKMNSWDEEAFAGYSELLKTAKKYNIK